MNLRIHHRLDRGYIESIDVSDGKLAGFLRYHVDNSAAYVRLMVVFQPYRGRGYAKAMLNHLFAHLYTIGAATVELFSYSLDGDEYETERLCGLYRRYGFVRSRSNRPTTGPGRYLCRI